ncbi:hypothetical protein GCM10007868_13480 [Gluconobacter frateurii]|uniref:Uncharacterized protein n=1 Tax=Gluconobacter frateurii NRIC 0228 TaxID=1307946 RepID=A0ABQ0QE17_9PROT|nr:hypothetical protein AA0228_2476 [Gluconobacter frateurii NRIC 0228]GLP90273.1 hypothetical protein GCM10007868_13480 [Gluconobacter frateurii]
MSARVRLYYPADGFGELICWRLESAYSHATIEFDGKIFSATVPRVVAVGLSDPDFGMPPRKGCCFEIRLTEEEAARALTYCQNYGRYGLRYTSDRWVGVSHSIDAETQTTLLL